MPASPAQTPRRAVAGELSHFSDRMNSAVAMRYVDSMMASIAIMSLWLPWAAGLEHFQHTVRDDEAADDVAGGCDNRDGPENGCQRRLTFAGQNNRANHRNRVQRVCQRHE